MVSGRLLVMTEIKLAEVRDRTSCGNEGTFLARIEEGCEGEQFVKYVSPYASGAKGGMIAVPEIGTQILVTKPKGSESWYYLGSTFEPEIRATNEMINPPAFDGGGASETLGGESGGSPFGAAGPRQSGVSPFKGAGGYSTQPFARIDPNISKISNVPNKILLKGNHGHGLEISDERDGVTTVGVKTELTSSNDKKITMHDSPGIDSIKIDSGNNASIELTQNPQDNPQKSAASIEIDSNGPQLHVCRESDLEMRVLGGGRELNIINSANGVSWGGVAGVPDAKLPTAGNVNIQSERGDINVFSNSPYTGRIFIETLNAFGQRQLIKLGTAGVDGAIVLQANSIVLDATGPGGTIDLNATGGVYINGGTGPVSTLGATIETFGTAGVNIDTGGVINLAGGTTAPPFSPKYPVLINPADIYNLDDYAGFGVI